MKHVIPLLLIATSCFGLDIRHYLQTDTNGIVVNPNLQPVFTNGISLGTNDLNHIRSFQFIPYDNGFTTEGQVYWDVDDHTLTLIPDLPAKLQVGQEQWIRIVNKHGSTISNGCVVSCISASGNRISGALADADNPLRTRVLGIATHNITNNQEGIVTSYGLVRELNTSMFEEGALLYLSTNAGAITTNYIGEGQTAPLIIGRCVVSHNNQGVIFVAPSPKETDPLATALLSSGLANLILTNSVATNWFNISEVGESNLVLRSIIYYQSNYYTNELMRVP
jgi:hypothetical protein